jgi:hypothetical protein
MSSSCHSRPSRGTFAIALAGISLSSIAIIPSVPAQELYFVPRFEVGSEWHSNRELIVNPAFRDEMVEYRALLEARLGRITPRSQVELRPRVSLQEFPDRSGIDPVELFCDLDTGFHTQRSEFLLFARYSRQDSFNAEYGNANFDPFNPESNADDTGISYIGDTRTRYTVEPDYSFAISERTRIGVGARYDNISYEPNDDRPVGTVGLIGYDSGHVELYLRQTMGPKLEVQIGPYFSRYESDDDLNQTDNYGVAIQARYSWSQIWETGLSVEAERNEATRPQSIPVEETTTNWGLELYGLRKGQTGSLRYSIGHFIEPSSVASMIETNQLRVQYDHIFTPRLIFNSALRLKESTRLGGAAGESADFARAELSLRWRMTQSWYLSGGYRYAWSDPATSTGTASDNAVFLSVGYRGLEPEVGFEHDRNGILR